MSSPLEVKAATIEEVLQYLREGVWQVPQFQREFVWTESQVIGLLDSILRARPIGMVTLWAQADDSELHLEPISIPDWDAEKKKTSQTYFAIPDQRPNSYFAVLDGRQRCTAIALAFGGLRPSHGNYRFSGRFYLNVSEQEPTRRIIFKKNKEVSKEELDKVSVCIGKGLFPLALDPQGEGGLFGQWMDFVQAIRDPNNYADGQLPDSEELDRRQKILKDAFKGLNATRLAVYTVPSAYGLDEICEVFETLNTTGTKVSPFDLIHSILYAETREDPDNGILLREWVSNLADMEGAVGWAVPDRRPELIAQYVTACYVGLDDKPDPRVRPGAGSRKVSSVKSGDLLATPASHWRAVTQNEDRFTDFLKDFQICTAEAMYPMEACPYPVSGAIYVALRWHYAFEPEDRSWGIDQLDALYRAFFWRNCLTRRYDQGFLTQLGADLKALRSILDERANTTSNAQWAAFAAGQLEKLIEAPLPTVDELVQWCLHSRPGGAMQKALQLPIHARIKYDILDFKTRFDFPETPLPEMHHIFPRKWCRSNAAGKLNGVLDPEKAGYNFRESVANLVPLSRKSNRLWSEKVPGQALANAGVSFEDHGDLLEGAFIDDKAFEALTAASPNPLGFWQRRASLIAKDLAQRMQIIL